jgi:hypothetical protein
MLCLMAGNRGPTETERVAARRCRFEGFIDASAHLTNIDASARLTKVALHYVATDGTKAWPICSCVRFSDCTTVECYLVVILLEFTGVHKLCARMYGPRS